jgi:acyl-coenzyme A synthetase/AMP-(fatty) acid ligase
MSVWDAFVVQVERRGDASALVWHGDDTSYRDLNEQAVAARTRLERLGLGDGEPVGVIAKKSPAAVALVLGCLAARRPFLLPSPTLGAEPLRQLFDRAGCRHVLTIDGDDVPAAASGDRATEPTDAVTRLAGVSFMLTTSGSTGLPKIVPLRDDAIGRFVAWAGEQFGIGPGCTVFNYAPLNFDLCLLDVWATLARGGRVALVDPDLATQGRHLLDVLRHDVAVVQAVPMAYRLLLDAAAPGDQPLDHVRHVLFTGDTIPARTLAELPRLFPNARLYNVYGCTETNDSFVHELAPVTAAGPAAAPVPIGRPVPGVDALIVRDDGTVVEGAGGGELWVTTPFQTDGYLDRSLDAGRFGPHPAGGGDRRWFRTGDLVRRLPDGSVVLDGRSDFQVKVRGTAVNTAEVERVILDHPDVVETAVVAVPDPLAGRRLCCAVRRASGSRLNSLALRKHCAQRLTQAAIPSDMHIGDEPLPKTSTGKVDRKQVENTHASRSTRS